MNLFLFVELFLLLLSYLFYTYLICTVISYAWFWLLVLYCFVASLHKTDKTHPLVNADKTRTPRGRRLELFQAKMGTFQRNAIISGYINSFCLVCEQFFETLDQTFSHIIGEDHENTLLAYPYLEKYGNNGIRKVKAGYFCEYCSQLMATGAKVNLHIAEKLHYYNKGNMLLKQSGSAFTAFDDVLITESAWHSFHEDECLLCDAEFDDQLEHMAERSHILKLLQNQVQFGNDNSVYRKIDKNDFQCLTCNTKLPLSEIDDHFGGDDHNQRYVKCQEEKKKHDLANPTPKAKPKEKTEISEDLKKALGQDNVVNNKETIAGIAESTTEANKKASITNNTEEKPTEAKEKKDKIKKEPKAPKFIIKEESSDPVIYAKDNQLIYDAKYQNTYCRTCQNKFPSSLRAMKEHVKGKEHINKLAKATPKQLEAPKRTKLFRQPMEDFIQHIRTFDNTLDNDIVLNEIFCVPEKSCHFFTKSPNVFGEYKCQICLTELFEEDMGDHCKTVQHEKGMRQSSIITNPKVKDDFIREVRLETFHCGFCNLILPGWGATEAHIKTAEHKSSVATCSRRLQIHLPAIRAQKNEDKMKAALFDMFVSRMRD